MISQLFEIDGLSFQVEAEMSHSSSKDKSECIHPKVTFTLLNKIQRNIRKRNDGNTGNGATKRIE